MKTLKEGVAMIVTCCFAHLLLAKVGATLLCVLAAGMMASLLTSLRCLAAQRAGAFEQIWSLYGAIREERMMLRAGNATYQAVAVRAAVVYLLCWCQIVVAEMLLRSADQQFAQQQARRAANLALGPSWAWIVAEWCPSNADPTATRGPGCDPCRPPDAGPPGWLPSRRTVGSSPGWRPRPG